MNRDEEKNRSEKEGNWETKSTVVKKLDGTNTIRSVQMKKKKNKKTLTGMQTTCLFHSYTVRSFKNAAYRSVSVEEKKKKKSYKCKQEPVSFEFTDAERENSKQTVCLF